MARRPKKRSTSLLPKLLMAWCSKRIEAPKRGWLAEDHVGGILALARAPVIGHCQRTTDLLMHRMKVAYTAIAHRWPVGSQLPIKKRLSFCHILQRDKTVLLALIAQSGVVHLPRLRLPPR